MILAGRKVQFDPLVNEKMLGVTEVRKPVIGTVVEDFERKRMFLVEYGEAKLRTCFHYADIGKGVTVL